MINTLININKLLNEVSTVRNKWKKGSIDKEKLTALEINYKKVIKLVKAADQIKLKFDLLIQESSKLNDAVKSIDYIKDMFEM